MRKNLLSLCSVLPIVVALIIMVSTAQAASVKDRMAARIPALTTLKDTGTIGENNRGYLEYRSQSKPQAQLVNGENKDRKLVYTAIAKNETTSATLVGKRRAKMIAKKGNAGQLFQKSDGSWYKK